MKAKDINGAKLMMGLAFSGSLAEMSDAETIGDWKEICNAPLTLHAPSNSVQSWQAQGKALSRLRK
jgi:hypothetical protein